MNSNDIAAYLDPKQSPPSERPELGQMSEQTTQLHHSIDDAIRKSGKPYLHPDGETLQVDLLGSPRIIEWQQAKQMHAFMAEECWSNLPQIYARYGTESTRTLLGKLREIENAQATVVTDCGMQACALLLDVVFRPGQHAVMMRQVYNKTKKYLERLTELQGGTFSIVDDGDFDALEHAIQKDTCLVFCETFTNPLMRAADLEKLGQIATHARQTGAKRLRMIVDSTIATPWATKNPILDTKGIDFVVASGTKALGGEDRDLWGYIASNRIEEMNLIMDLQATRGGILDWRRAKAVLAGFDNAPERYEQRCASAKKVAAFLSEHPRVSEVFHPSLPKHPDRRAIESQYRATGSLLSFRVDGADEEGCRHFCDVLATTTLPRYALSFDGLTSKLNHHFSVSEYFTPVEELERAGIDRLVRLGVGLEASDDLIACLNWALWQHDQMSAEDTEAWRTARCQDLGIYGEASDR